MGIQKISFLTPDDGEHKLVVTLQDGTVEEYTQLNKDLYLQRYPDRASDIVACNLSI
jgi:hypothetical protein